MLVPLLPGLWTSFNCRSYKQYYATFFKFMFFVKVKLPLSKPRRHILWALLWFQSFLTRERVGSEWSTAPSGRFTLQNNPVPIERETRWTPQPVWTFWEKRISCACRNSKATRLLCEYFLELRFLWQTTMYDWSWADRKCICFRVALLP
jgi:hypothetical protein